MSKGKKITFVVIFLLLIGLLLLGLYAYHIISTITTESSPINTENLAVNRRLDNKVINIACFGLDGRDDEEVEGDRTDVIMIGTLDTRDNSIKLTSVMRDTFVKICVEDSEESEVYAGDQDGIEWDSDTQTTYNTYVDDEDDEIQIDTDTTETENDYDSSTKEYSRVTVDYENKLGVAEYTKINAAFLGGVESSIKTLNENFDLNIEDYVTVDFECLMDVVDAVGGIEVDITSEDLLDWTNKFIHESNYYGKRNDPELTHTGLQTVTGAQALAFARVRYTDSDYGRSMRQREVVQAIFDKVKTMDAFTAINVLNQVYPYVQTSLSLTEITEYARFVLNSENISFESYRIPTNDHGTGGYANSVWYLFPDTLVDNCIALHNFIYGADNNYVPSSRVKQISQEIEDYMDYRAYDLQVNIGESEDPAVTIEEDPELNEAMEAEDVTEEGSEETVTEDYY